MSSIPQAPKPETNSTPSAPSVVRSSDLGYLIMWEPGRSNKHTQVKQNAIDAGLPQDISDGIEAHSLKAAVSLASSDRSFKSIKVNESRVEAKVIAEDANGNLTIGFLAYRQETTPDGEKGSRYQLDKVVIDSQHNWMFKGTTDVADAFVSSVNYHLDFIGGNNIYERVTKPCLNKLRAVRVARNVYYVRSSKQNEALITAWDTFFTSIGYSLICLTQKNDLRTRNGLTSRVSKNLRERVEDVKDRILDWKSKNRVHGRSQDKLLSDLAEILQDTTEIESSLEANLKDLKDTVEQARLEALGIINNQAPSGVNPAVYSDIKAVFTDVNVFSTSDAGNIYCVASTENSLNQYVKGGTRLTAPADKCARSLGYYAYVTDGFIVFRPLAELQEKAS